MEYGPARGDSGRFAYHDDQLHHFILGVFSDFENYIPGENEYRNRAARDEPDQRIKRYKKSVVMVENYITG